MIAVICATALLACAYALPVTDTQNVFQATANFIEGEYIVSLKPSVDMEQHLKEVQAMIKTKGGKIEGTFSIGDQSKNADAHVFKGYHAALSPEEIEMVSKMEAVSSVEKNQIYHTNADKCLTQDEATWGIVRTTEKDLKITGEYVYEDKAGDKVDVYVIDTGIYVEHNDFEGRATFGTSTAGGSGDGNGHGTHCAGTIMSKTWGLAKDANAIAVKVLSDSGSGSTAGVIAGIEWAAKQTAASKKTAVANLSLGGGFSSAMNSATNAAHDAGLLMVVAAGNDSRDACSYSPASAEKAFTVGATDNKDARSYFSNTGNCVDIFAPGSAITSTWIGGVNSDNTISGTSMAAPHVAGVAAKYLAANPKATPQEIKDALIASSTPNKITGLTTTSPNKLLYQPCLA